MSNSTDYITELQSDLKFYAEIMSLWVNEQYNTSLHKWYRCLEKGEIKQINAQEFKSCCACAETDNDFRIIFGEYLKHKFKETACDLMNVNP